MVFRKPRDDLQRNQRIRRLPRGRPARLRNNRY
jgi:hypothetical protein